MLFSLFAKLHSLYICTCVCVSVRDFADVVCYACELNSDVSMFSFSIWLFLLIMVSMLVFSFDFLFFLFIHSVVWSFVRSAGLSDSYLPPFPCHNHFCICSFDHFHFHFESISSWEKERKSLRERNGENVFYICQINVFVYFTWHRIQRYSNDKNIFPKKGKRERGKTKTANENENGNGNEMNKTKQQQLKNNCLGRNCTGNRTIHIQSTRNCAQRNEFFCCFEKITMRKWSENKRPT